MHTKQVKAGVRRSAAQAYKILNPISCKALRLRIRHGVDEYGPETTRAGFG